MKVTIQDIAYHLPSCVVTNDDLKEEHPDWDMGQVQARTGVMSRHIANSDETALDLSVQACEKLFRENPGTRERIDGIIFCTQSPDYVMPPNSCILHNLLELGDEVFAFDYNLACSAYPYGLALAQGLLLSGVATNILLVTADTYSKYINKSDRSARVLFGDGAAVSWICASDSSQGIVDIQCCTSGKDYEKFIVPAGACRLPKSKDTSIPHSDENGNVHTLENIHMNGMGVLAFINSKVPAQVRSILACNDMAIKDVDMFIFHQSSNLALDSLTRLLKLDPGRVYRNLSHIGNTVSSSIPIALKDAITDSRVGRGDKVLLSGFGVGLSWGTAIIEM